MSSDSRSILRDCQAITDFSRAVQILRLADVDEWGPRHIVAAGEHLSKLVGQPEIKVAILSSFTLDLLPPHCVFQSALAGIQCSTWVAPYNQYQQQILTDDSEFRQLEPDVVVVVLDLRDISRPIVDQYGLLSVSQREDAAIQVVQHCKSVVDSITGRLAATVLLANFPFPQSLSRGVADGHASDPEMEFYGNLNRSLRVCFEDSRQVHILDIARLAAGFGSARVFDPKMYYMAKMCWSESFYPAVSRELVRHFVASLGRARKCLVVDLDNTLWGGVVGEEGPLGVRIGPGDPVGEAYRDVQTRIKNLKCRGILLAICSKNNRSEIDEIFAKRPDMPLAIDDFDAVQTNWEPKPVNIERIARSLNIGLESIVFLDDNPAECALMQQMHPQVVTVRMPDDPEKMPTVVDELVYFEKTAILVDDREKSIRYRENRQREDARLDSGDLVEYLNSLQTRLEIGPARMDQIERIHQLFSKTNQFNVATIRYTLPQIETMINTPEWDLTLFSAQDRFGDLGTIGLYLIERLTGFARIDSFLMSCRALGRGIETAAMNHLKQGYLINRSTERLSGRYFPTSRNIPARGFFAEQGFQCLSQNETCIEYSMNQNECELLDCDWISVTTGLGVNGR